MTEPIKVIIKGGQTALLDAEDIPLLEGLSLSLSRPKRGSGFLLGYNNKIHKLVNIRRIIMKAPPGVDVVPVDGNGLNCTKANLRLGTRSATIQYCRKAWGESGIKGVVIRGNSIGVRVTYKRKQYWLGSFDTIDQAKAAYDNKMRELHGAAAMTHVQIDTEQFKLLQEQNSLQP